MCVSIKSVSFRALSDGPRHDKIDSKQGRSETHTETREIRSRRNVRRHLPEGKGPHTVGIVDFMCDTGKNEYGCFVRLYYPTEKTDVYEWDKQWPLWLPHKRYGQGYAHFLQWNRNVFGKLFNWLGGDVYVPALWQANVLKSKTPFPVIIFSHGLGGNRTTYSTMCLELASQGYVVAALEHRDGSASMTLCLKNGNSSSIYTCQDQEYSPDSTNDSTNTYSNINHSLKHHNHNLFQEEWKWFEHVEKWDDFHLRNGQMYKRRDECQHVLDMLSEMNDGATLYNNLGINFSTKQFKGQLDMTRVAVIGHSFGGATCIATLAQDPRFKVGVILDGWMHPVDDRLPALLAQPLLMVNMESFQWKKNIQHMMELQKNLDVERTMITIKGTCHQSVTDFQFLCNKPFGRIMEVRYKLNPKSCMDLSSKATLGFLWKHLKTEMDHKIYYDEILLGQHSHIIHGTNVRI